MDSDGLSSKVVERLRLTAKTFRRQPFNGQALQAMVKGETDIPEKTNSLSPPVRCERDASIIVAQYVSLANDHLPSYWFGVVPELLDGYGDRIRYEHHDVPALSSGGTPYKLASLGRAVQDEYGDSAFWSWFDILMEEGVNNMDEAYDLVTRIDISDAESPGNPGPRNANNTATTSESVNVEVLRESVDNDLYENIISHDMMTLESRGLDIGNQSPSNGSRFGRPEEQGLFAVFVNGNPVQPSYEAIAGAIESMKYGSI